MLHLVSSLSVGKVLLSSLRTSKTFFHCTQKFSFGLDPLVNFSICLKEKGIVSFRIIVITIMIIIMIIMIIKYSFIWHCLKVRWMSL